MLSSSFVALLNHLLTRAEWARRRLSPFARHPARLMLEGPASTSPLPPTVMFALRGQCGSRGDNQRAGFGTTGPARRLGPGHEGGEDQRQCRDGRCPGFRLRNLRWDPEADLAALVGDVAAHRLHEGVLSLLSTAFRCAGGGNNPLEYLTIEEDPAVAHEIEQHVDRLRELRDAVARLEKRIERIER